MSYASEIKKEVNEIEVDDCCVRAEAAALIRMNGTISVSKERFTLDVQTENAAIARRIYSLIKSIYSYPVKLIVRKKMKLKKNNVYIIRLVKNVAELLSALDILHEPYEFVRTISKSYFKKACCRKAYLRGAFLAGGSVNNPETSSYHLEIFNFHKDHNDSLCELLNTFDLRARVL